MTSIFFGPNIFSFPRVYSHISMQHLSWRHLSISAIFQLLLTFLHPFFSALIVWTTNFCTQFFFFWLDFFIQNFLYKNFFGLKLSWDQIFFNLSSLGLRFLEQYFCRHLFFYLNFVDQAANGAQKWPTGS